MVRRDAMNHTPEEASQYLAAALELTASQDVPEDLREAFFVQAVQLLSGKQILFEQPQPTMLPPLFQNAR